MKWRYSHTAVRIMNRVQIYYIYIEWKINPLTLYSPNGMIQEHFNYIYPVRVVWDQKLPWFWANLVISILWGRKCKLYHFMCDSVVGSWYIYDHEFLPYSISFAIINIELSGWSYKTYFFFWMNICSVKNTLNASFIEYWPSYWTWLTNITSWKSTTNLWYMYTWLNQSIKQFSIGNLLVGNSSCKLLRWIHYFI